MNQKKFFKSELIRVLLTIYGIILCSCLIICSSFVFFPSLLFPTKNIQEKDLIELLDMHENELLEIGAVLEHRNRDERVYANESFHTNAGSDTKMIQSKLQELEIQSAGLTPHGFEFTIKERPFFRRVPSIILIYSEEQKTKNYYDNVDPNEIHELPFTSDEDVYFPTRGEYIIYKHLRDNWYVEYNIISWP